MMTPSGWGLSPKEWDLEVPFSSMDSGFYGSLSL